MRETTAGGCRRAWGRKSGRGSWGGVGGNGGNMASTSSCAAFDCWRMPFCQGEVWGGGCKMKCGR
eukprot:353925-Chlamydomonas_euryale.AAC.8